MSPARTKYKLCGVLHSGTQFLKCSSCILLHIWPSAVVIPEERNRCFLDWETTLCTFTTIHGALYQEEIQRTGINWQNPTFPRLGKPPQHQPRALRPTAAPAQGSAPSLHAFWDAFYPSPSPLLSPGNVWSNPKCFTYNRGKTSEGEGKKQGKSTLSLTREADRGELCSLWKKASGQLPYSLLFPGTRP